MSEISMFTSYRWIKESTKTRRTQGKRLGAAGIVSVYLLIFTWNLTTFPSNYLRVWLCARGVALPRQYDRTPINVSTSAVRDTEFADKLTEHSISSRWLDIIILTCSLCTSFTKFGCKYVRERCCPFLLHSFLPSMNHHYFHGVYTQPCKHQRLLYPVMNG